MLNNPAIGLTGGIACGKSTVMQILASSGMQVIDSDQIARQVVAPGTSGLEEIRDAFGEAVIDRETGGLDRRAMANIVFENRDHLIRLQNIIHPRVYACIDEQVGRLRQRGPVIAEIPLLFETEGADRFDQVWVVACSHELQIQRVAARGWDAREFHRRNAAQMPLQKKMDSADLVIWNELSMDWLHPQIDRALDLLGGTDCRLRKE
jgi:dephospho-CoA kinase